MNGFSNDQLETALLVLKNMRTQAEKEISNLNSAWEAGKVPNASRWRREMHVLARRVETLTVVVQDLDECINDGY